MCNNPNSRFLFRLIADIVILIGVYCIALLLLPRWLPTVPRGFFCRDHSLRFPYAGTLLSRVHITIIVIALPSACMLIVEMLSAACRSNRRRIQNNATPSNQHNRSTTTTTITHNTPIQRFTFVGINIPSFVSECYKIVGVYLFGLALTLIAMRLTKHCVGRLRPYFFDVCQPQLPQGGSACDAQNGTSSAFIDRYECFELAASAELLQSVQHSFPSGYATTVSYAMCFLVIYLQARLLAPWLRLFKSLLQLGCFVLALLVASERVYSYLNHRSDVGAGAVLGIGMAVFVTNVVADLFRREPVKRRRWREEVTTIYGYYGVNRVPKYR